jgi:hypothetical protein
LGFGYHYIRVKEGFLYLTTVLDLYDRKIIGWSLSSGMSVKKLHWRLGEWLLKPKHHKGIAISLTEVFNTPVKFTNVVDYKIITRIE